MSKDEKDVVEITEAFGISKKRAKELTEAIDAFLNKQLEVGKDGPIELLQEIVKLCNSKEEVVVMTASTVRMLIAVGLLPE